VNAPAIHIGGWYDIYAQGTIDAFMGYQYNGGEGARGKQKLIMGPWAHTQFGYNQSKTGQLANFLKINSIPFREICLET